MRTLCHLSETCSCRRNIGRSWYIANAAKKFDRRDLRLRLLQHACVVLIREEVHLVGEPLVEQLVRARP